jgi:threonylcarbamoyladenosine tRNA methylthiotransferase MtaB
MKVSLLTLGCRVNQSESHVIEGTLKKNGVTIVDLSKKPDFCIVNTCTVTARSDYNSRQLIRRAARAGAKVIVTGCYSQIRPSDVSSLQGVEKVVDINDKYDIVSMITSKEADLHFVNYGRSRPYLKVQDGCNFRCSYCTVPMARGRSRSIPVKDVLERAKAIEERGYSEIVLTGIHLGTYGHDLPVRTNINSLLKSLLKETKIQRIRLSSIEINEIDDELVESIKDDRICNHLHIPLQSGSDKILRLMRRNYTSDNFALRLSQIEKRMKNISIGTDIIVGFPEEGGEEFESTFDLVGGLPFSYLHVFPFSVRPGTEAAVMMGRPSSNAITERMAKMIELGRRKKYDYMKRQINGKLDIVLEERVNKGTVVGTSGNYLKISVNLGQFENGTLVSVRPTGIADDMLIGNVIN